MELGHGVPLGQPLTCAPKFHSLASPHSLAHPRAKCHSLARPDHLSFVSQWGRVGWGNNIYVPVHTHRHSNLIIFLAVLQTQALHCSFIPVGWGGVGCDGVMWGGVGWGNNVHVPVHTQAQQPHHFSCCPADTGTALLFHDQLPVGVGVGNRASRPCRLAKPPAR